MNIDLVKVDTTLQRQPIFDFIDSFLDGRVKERWRFICGKKMLRWSQLDPYHLWNKSDLGRASSHDFLGKNIQEIFSTYNLESLKQKKVLVMYFGHTQPALLESSLVEALTGKDSPLEGLIILDAKNLVFCFTHEGEIRVFESEIANKARKLNSK
jgi:hypothetical protein